MGFERCNLCAKATTQYNAMRCGFCGYTMCEKCHKKNGGVCTRCGEEMDFYTKKD